MACERYAIWRNAAGRKVTQPLHHNEEPRQVYICKDGTRLPLFDVQSFPIRPMHTVPADAIADQNALQARMRARNETLFGRKAVA